MIGQNENMQKKHN